MNKSLVLQKADVDSLVHLKALWLVCFPEDQPGDVDAFYDTLFSDIDCLVGLIDGHPVTMLHLLPAIAYVRGAPHKVRYLYAGGTHPEHRHCGYYAALMQFAAEYVSAMGEEGIYLHPASPQLIPLYERSGYRMCIHSALPVHYNASAQPATISISSYADMRHAHIRRTKPDCVYFEPNATISTLFLSADIREGAQLYSNGEDIFLLNEGRRCYPFPPVTATREAAMWLAAGDNHTISDAIVAHGGLTAILGE